MKVAVKICRKEKKYIFAVQIDWTVGRAARLRSAKPATAVQIRYRPQLFYEPHSLLRVRFCFFRVLAVDNYFHIIKFITRITFIQYIHFRPQRGRTQSYVIANNIHKYLIASALY